MGMSTPILVDMHHLYGSNSNNFYLTFFCLLKHFGRQGHHVFHSQVDPHNCFGFSAIMLLLIRFITSSGVSDNVWSSILSVVFSKNELSVLDNKFSVKTLSSVSFPIFNSYYSQFPQQHVGNSPSNNQQCTPYFSGGKQLATPESALRQVSSCVWTKEVVLNRRRFGDHMIHCWSSVCRLARTKQSKFKN
jgi:hypothetical protein